MHILSGCTRARMWTWAQRNCRKYRHQSKWLCVCVRVFFSVSFHSDVYIFVFCFFFFRFRYDFRGWGESGMMTDKKKNCLQLHCAHASEKYSIEAECRWLQAKHTLTRDWVCFSALWMTILRFWGKLNGDKKLMENSSDIDVNTAAAGGVEENIFF